MPIVSAGSQPASASAQESNPAEVIDAEGRYLEKLAQTDRQFEETRRVRMDNDYHKSELKRLRRDNSPSSEEERQRLKAEDLRRALNPPVQEIYSGKAPNILLDDLKGYPGLYQGQGPEVPLEEDCRRQIHVMSGQDTGNVAMLKKELSWPVTLRGADYEESREALNSLVPQAVKQAAKGNVEADTLRDLKGALGNLSIQLSGNIDKLPAPRHIEAKRFLGQLDDALKVLAKPHAANYFNGKFSAKGNTVAELVRHMSREGLKFAPALTGDETAYEGLHKALAVYDVAAHTSRTE
jgi:hypothetical protein